MTVALSRQYLLVLQW